MTLLADIESQRRLPEKDIEFIKYKVSKIEGDDQICSRLREIGLRSGSILKFLGRAPFRGPLFVQFKNSSWALRTNEAECIYVVRLNASSVGSEFLPQISKEDSK